MPRVSLNRVTLNIDGELQVIRPRTVFRGTLPETGSQFMVVAQRGNRAPYSIDSVGLICREEDETAVIALMRKLLRESNPSKTGLF